MNEQMDIEVVRTEALRKLGRNVVNFAKIEAAFKQLLSISQVEGTPKTISDQLRKNQARLHKQTLGCLVQEFHKNIMSDPGQSKPTPDVSREEGISISFKVAYDDPDFFKAQKRARSNIVAERNRLIHQDLALLDTSSVEDYLKLISLLDEQNPRLLAHLEELRWMIESLRECLAKFKDLYGDRFNQT
ncbi:hypothetical protein [Chamaesiphon sp. OTE_75_metabat_556]|uniref:hypothetical protein n=1 Tax=Chamaesiphon sp. OTE_75_metabat_556 TaxID=2964692 RepID=UPI00286CEB79|nr:hypothetical protein [Chamaesiphon sp. OTE_75_metabat_556]